MTDVAVEVAETYCPTCGARPGQQCLTGSGALAYKPHRQRVTAAQKRRESTPRAVPDWKSSGKTKSPIPKGVRRRCEARSSGLCELSTPRCPDRPHQAARVDGTVMLHHIWRRGQGGPHTEENLLAGCFDGHDWVHTHVAEAKALGLLRVPTAEERSARKAHARMVGR